MKTMMGAVGFVGAVVLGLAGCAAESTEDGAGSSADAISSDPSSGAAAKQEQCWPNAANSVYLHRVVRNGSSVSVNKVDVIGNGTAFDRWGTLPAAGTTPSDYTMSVLRKAGLLGASENAATATLRVSAIHDALKIQPHDRTVAQGGTGAAYCTGTWVIGTSTNGDDLRFACETTHRDATGKDQTRFVCGSQPAACTSSEFGGLESTFTKLASNTWSYPGYSITWSRESCDGGTFTLKNTGSVAMPYPTLQYRAADCRSWEGSDGVSCYTPMCTWSGSGTLAVGASITGIRATKMTGRAVALMVNGGIAAGVDFRGCR